MLRLLYFVWVRTLDQEMGYRSLGIPFHQELIQLNSIMTDVIANRNVSRDQASHIHPKDLPPVRPHNPHGPHHG